MNKKILFALLVTLGSIGLHFHLTLHWYPLHFGAPVESTICNLGTQFNCDVAAASPYGQLFGIPISLWGAMTHVALLLFLLGYILGFTDAPQRSLRFAFLLSSLALLASVVMGFISTFFLAAYCPLCVVLYALSLINFELLRRSQTESFWHSFVHSDLPRLWSESKASLIMIASIPVASLLVHLGLASPYDSKELNLVLQQSVLDWAEAPQVPLTAAASLRLGPEDASVVVSEFADFRCIHCKRVAPILKTFAQVHRDVRVDFYAFPLDGQCNPAISQQGDGVSCQLAKATLCAEKLDEQGWAMHDLIFDHFEAISGLRSLSAADERLRMLSFQLNLEWEEMQACLDAPETHEAITAQALAGQLARVRGTPSVFVNGRPASAAGQSLVGLQAIRREALRQK